MSIISKIFRRKTPERVVIEVIEDVLASSPAVRNETLAVHILDALRDAEIKL